jgi:glycosyltransferase involved in cell wall biosynthesis
VIAYGVGGALETVQDGVTGALFGEQDADGLAAAIGRFEAMALDESAIRENAAGFSRRRFREQLAGVIAGARPG